jgi:hypothetical protein
VSKITSAVAKLPKMLKSRLPLVEPDYYRLLALPPSASPEEIEQRCRERVRNCHPDINPSQPDAEALTAILRAREVLSNQDSRVAYQARQGAGRLSAITCVSDTQVSALAEHLRYWQYEVLWLDGTGVYGRQSFMQQAYRDLPNLYGYSEGGSWATFLDVLRESLSQREPHLLVIIWTEVQNMLRGGLSDLLTVHSVFEKTIRDLAAGPSPGDSKTLLVILTGKGPNFPLVALLTE